LHLLYESTAYQFGVRDRFAECIGAGYRFCFFHVVTATITLSFYNELDHSAYEPSIGPIVTVQNGMLPAFNADMLALGGIRYLQEYSIQNY